MTNDATDLESLFGRICALDKCLGRVRQAQQSAKTEIQPKEESDEQKVRALILNRKSQNRPCRYRSHFCIVCSVQKKKA